MTTARPPQASLIRGGSLAVFVATRAEMRPLARALQPTDQSAHRSHSIIRIRVGDRELLLAKTGVGPDHAESAAHRLFAGAPVAAALAFGVAGGLSPQAQTGDLIVADRVILRRNLGQTSFPCNTDLQEATMTVLRRFDSRHYLGPILTIDRIVRTAEEKRVLMRESGAVAVDMESAAVASAASAHSVPFLAVRGVLDPIHEELAIDFDQFLDAEGEPHLPRLMRYLITHPFALPHLVGLGRRTKAVCAHLGRLLQELSTTLH